MATYENCYEILSDVRRVLEEYSAAYLKGTDTTSPHSNEYIVKKINQAQRYIFNMLFRRIPDVFLKIEDFTITSSAGTLPWDFGRLRYFKDENGHKVHSIGMEDLRLASQSGSNRQYYRKGNTLVINKAGVSETYTLCYYTKPRDITQGKASAGGSLTITLATSAKKIADYYIGMTIENSTKDWVDTIDAYTTGRVATITEAAAENDYYGLVSEFPESFHYLIAPKVIHAIKSESFKIEDRHKLSNMQEWNSDLLEALRSFAGTALDEDVEDLFLDYEPEVGFGSYIINE